MTNKPPNGSEISESDFSQQLELARFGPGSSYMDAEQALKFAEYAYACNFGISRMEAYGEGESRGKHALYHQILGIDDDGENWMDHKNASMSLRLVKNKLSEARQDGLTLKYKFWVDDPE